ncbi:MAG: hypothetical protein H0V07_07020 [Propionibacteriales bacterium]|nr:hypothetical protein [Propionibacteriales bacterium]
MKPSTLLLLRDLLHRQQLQVGADDFRDTALQVIDALDDLDAAIANTTD